MADVGRKDILPTGMEQTSNNVPTWMFGKQASNSQQLQRRYRPDILLVENLTHASTWVPGIEVYQGWAKSPYVPYGTDLSAGLRENDAGTSLFP